MDVDPLGERAAVGMAQLGGDDARRFPLSGHRRGQSMAQHVGMGDQADAGGEVGEGAAGVVGVDGRISLGAEHRVQLDRAGWLTWFDPAQPDGGGLAYGQAEPKLDRERERFWTALGNLRSMLRKATGASELKAIERDGDRYRVDPTVFAVDLWRFQQALAAARHAQLDPAVAAALAQAGEAYGGVLLDGAPYAWVEVPREVRRRAVDALARLAELRQGAGDPEGALSALEQAVE